MEEEEDETAPSHSQGGIKGMSGTPLFRSMEAEEEQQQSVQQRPPVLGSHPWLVYFHGRHRKSQAFYSMEEGHYQVKSIPKMRRMQIGACLHGWLVLVHDTKDDCFLLNSTSNQDIQLPPLKDFRVNYCALSLPPSDPDCVVMFFYNLDLNIIHVMFCKPGDTQWSKKDLKLEIGNLVEGVGVYNGGVYVFTFFEELYLIKVDDNLRLIMLDKKVDAKDSVLSTMNRAFRKVFLVETYGELFRVDQYTTELKSVVYIGVFKLDFEKKRWIRLRRMKNHAFFLGACGIIVSCSTKDSRIQGNRIYFTLPEDRSLYEFDLGKGVIRASLPCPNVKHEWSQPNWILSFVKDK